MVVHARRRESPLTDPSRIAVVAGRKVGGAVARNRAKRRLRAAIAGVVVPSGFDMVLVARRTAASVTFSVLRAELERLLRQVVAQPEAGLRR